jgi:integrase
MGTKRRGKRVVTPGGVRVLGKNANREGSVYRQADGRWCATWWEPGRPRPRKATGKTRQKALDRRDRRRAESGPDVAELRNLARLADWWLHNVHKHAVRRQSWSRAEDRVRRIKATLGHLDVADLDYRVVSEWQTALLALPQPPRHRPLKPRTVRHHRQTLAQIVDEAVKMQLLVGNVVRSVSPPSVPDEPVGGALKLDEIHALIHAAAEHRIGAAVAVLFLQGWRVSEVLGLAWSDLDLAAGTVKIQRASVYIDGVGQTLGPTKNQGAQGEHWLMPTVIDLLRHRRDRQDQERQEAPTWQEVTYRGEPVDLVFTTPDGGMVLRQTVAKIVKQAAKTAGIAADLSTHTGRRSLITALFADGGEALEDIARFVGHANPATTAGYVKHLGQRPRAVSQRAARLLDKRSDPSTPAEKNPGVRNHSAPDGSDQESNHPGTGHTTEDDHGQ